MLVKNAKNKRKCNILNVAISRAKKHLFIVANGNDIQEDSNLAQLITYIKYNNFDIKESKLHSVFDILYNQYTKKRLIYESSHSSVSEHLSENLKYSVLTSTISELKLINTEVICHYPL